MDNHPLDETLKLYLRNGLAEAEEAQIDSHLADCEECQRRLESLENFGVPADVEKHRDRQRLPNIAGLQLLAQIGRGGMAIVYRAIDRDRRIVAVKMPLNDEPDLVTRFRHERELAFQLSKLNHPHIVPVFEQGETNDRPYFTMAYAANGTLATRERELHQQPLQVARLMLEVARAIGVLHAQSQPIIHRDVKPENILLFPEDQGNGAANIPLVQLRAVLTDIGLAREVDQTGQSRTDDIRGTLQYMAPELLQSSRLASPRSDVYSIGATMYRLLTGEMPYPHQNPIHLLNSIFKSDPPRPNSVNPSARISPSLELICLKCLLYDPRHRYANGNQLADDLQSYLDDKPIQAKSLSYSQRSRRWVRRNPIGALLMLCMMIVITIGTVYARSEVLRARSEARNLATLKHVEQVNSARSAAGRGDWVPAMKLYTEVIQAGRDDQLQLRIERLFGFFAINDRQQLRNELNELLKRDDLGQLRAQVLLVHGADLMCDSDRQEVGRQAIREALSLRMPFQSPADELLAKALLEDKPTPVLNLLKQAVDLGPTHYTARSCYVVALFAAGKPREAGAEAAQIQTLFPNSPVPSLVRGILALHDADPEIAKQEFAEMARLLGRDATGIDTFRTQLTDSFKRIRTVNLSIMGMSQNQPIINKAQQFEAPNIQNEQPLGVAIPTVHLLWPWVTEIINTLGKLFENKSPEDRAAEISRLENLRKDYPDGIITILLAQYRLRDSLKVIDQGTPKEAIRSLTEVATLAYEGASAPTMIEKSNIRFIATCMAMIADIGALKFAATDERARFRRIRDQLPNLINEGRKWKNERIQGVQLIIAIGTVEMLDRQLTEWKLDTAEGKRAYKQRIEDIYSIMRAMIDDLMLDEPENNVPKILRIKLDSWYASVTKPKS